jgi:hypothetical protein
MTASEKWDDYLKVGDRRDVDMGTALSIVADLAAKERESSDLSLRLEQMRGALADLMDEVDDVPRSLETSECFKSWKACKAALSTPPGELVREVRRIANNYLIKLGAASDDDAEIETVCALLARLGGEA